jgi:hypothetical protein
MKRFGILVGGMFLGSIIAGCDSGIPEGQPKGATLDPAPPSFRDEMKKNAANMLKQGKPKTAPAPEKPAGP